VKQCLPEQAAFGREGPPLAQHSIIASRHGYRRGVPSDPQGKGLLEWFFCGAKRRLSPILPTAEGIETLQRYPTP